MLSEVIISSCVLAVVLNKQCQNTVFNIWKLADYVLRTEEKIFMNAAACIVMVLNYYLLVHVCDIHIGSVTYHLSSIGKCEIRPSVKS